MTLPIIVSITLWFIGLVVAGVLGYFGGVVKITNRLTRLEDRADITDETCKDIKELKKTTDKVDIASIKQLEERMRTLEVKTDVFWKVLEPHFAGIIHSPEHSVRDILIDKLVNGALKIEEAPLLQSLLTDLIEKTKNSEDKVAAVFLLARVTAMIAVGSVEYIKQIPPDIKILGSLKVVGDIKPGDEVNIIGEVSK